MLDYLKNLFKNDFFKNIFTLITGNSIAQLIGLIAIPVLSRMYTPEEFGEVALFISIINVIAIAANFRYDMAVVPPKRNGQAFHLLVGSIVIAVFFTILLFIIVAIFKEKLTSFFDHDVFNKIIWLLPLLIFLLASHKSLQFWFNRKREYKTIAMNRVVLSSTQTGIKLARFAFTNGYWGLVIGTLIGQIIAWALYVFRVIKTDLWRFKYFSFKTLIKSFKEYSNFPKYLMPMGILNSFSVNILIFSLSAIASSSVVGYYERAWRVINMPFSLLSTSFGNVFYEQMAKTSNPQRLYVSSYFINLTIATVVLIPIMIWGESIFSFVLGREWAMAGTIAKLLVPLTIFNYATACVSNVFSVYKRNQLLLVWQITYLVIVVSWIFFAKIYDIYFLIRIYAYIGGAIYAVLAYMGYLVVKNQFSNVSNN
jgi:O-antigen/teichoic acid export membrane protein